MPKKPGKAQPESGTIEPAEPDKQHLTPEQIREIAEHRAEALKRVQEMHKQSAHHDMIPGRGGQGGKGPKNAPPKARNFRHQGR